AVLLPVPGVIDLAVHPTGAELVFLDRSDRLWSYDLRTAAPPRRLPQRFRAVVRSLSFDPAGTRLTVVGTEGKLTTLDWRSGAARATGQPGLSPVARGPGGWVATPTAAGGVVMYDVAAGRAVWTLPPAEGDVWGLEFAPDGRRLAV